MTELELILMACPLSDWRLYQWQSQRTEKRKKAGQGKYEGENEWERWTERETESLEDYGRKRQLWWERDDRLSSWKVINVDICVCVCVCVRVHLHHLPWNQFWRNSSPSCYNPLWLSVCVIFHIWVCHLSYLLEVTCE